MYTRLRAGRTGTRQYSPYQLKTRSDGTVGIDDCDNERYAGAAKNTLPRTKNKARPKNKYYCWSCGSNYTHGRKKCSSKKAGHQEEAYYKNIMGGSEK